jgi:hypothetical protein
MPVQRRLRGSLRDWIDSATEHRVPPRRSTQLTEDGRVGVTVGAGDQRRLHRAESSHRMCRLPRARILLSTSAVRFGGADPRCAVRAGFVSAICALALGGLRGPRFPQAAKRHRRSRAAATCDDRRDVEQVFTRGTGSRWSQVRAPPSHVRAYFWRSILSGHRLFAAFGDRSVQQIGHPSVDAASKRQQRLTRLVGRLDQRRTSVGPWT